MNLETSDLLLLPGKNLAVSLPLRGIVTVRISGVAAGGRYPLPFSPADEAGRSSDFPPFDKLRVNPKPIKE